MNPREIAIYLNECTDEQFIETFALLYQAIYGRGVPVEYDEKEIIKIMDVKQLCDKLEKILTEIKGE